MTVEWGTVENRLYALYMNALRRVAPAPERESEPGLFASLARRLGWEARRESSLAIVELRGPIRAPTEGSALPSLHASTVEDVDGQRRARMRPPRAIHEVAVDRTRMASLAKMLANEASLGADWDRFQDRYTECLHGVAARIEREAPLALDAAPDFVCKVDASRWVPARPGEAPLLRFAIPPPPSPAQRSRWRDARTELAATEVASELLDEAARDAELGVHVDRATLLRAVRLVLRAQPELDDAGIDSALEVIDRGIDTVLNAILHDEELQSLEATWRSIAYLVEQIDFRENIRLDLLQGDRDEVAADLRRATALEGSALHRHVYTSGYSPRACLPAPVSILVGLWEIGPDEEEIDLLEDIATVAMRAHAVALMEPAASMFGYTRGSGERGLRHVFGHPRTIFTEASHERWRAFRESAASRHVGLCAVRFRVRRPYETTSPFRFREHVDGTGIGPPWASSAILLVARMADAFARYRLVINFIGRGQAGGVIEGLPGRPPSGGREEGPFAEETVTSRLGYQLEEQGFIGWDSKTHFLIANSCHQPRIFENTAEGKRAENDYRLATQLPYYLFATRVAQYLKVIRLTTYATLHDRAELERALCAWLNGLSEPDRAGRLLDHASVTLLEHDDAWLAFELELHPRFKYMGATFTLRANGFLEG